MLRISNLKKKGKKKRLFNCQPVVRQESRQATGNEAWRKYWLQFCPFSFRKHQTDMKTPTEPEISEHLRY
jgi:hypothetical protein